MTKLNKIILLLMLGAIYSSTLLSAEDSHLRRPDLIRDGRIMEPLTCSQLIEEEVIGIKKKNKIRVIGSGLTLGGAAIAAALISPVVGAIVATPVLEQVIQLISGTVRIGRARKLDLIFEQAEAGDGHELMKLVNKIQRKNPEYTTDIIISTIRLVNDSRTLCWSGDIKNANTLQAWIVTPEYAVVDGEKYKGAEPILDWSTYKLNQDIRHDREILRQ